jgi:hypothetical protein
MLAKLVPRTQEKKQLGDLTKTGREDAAPDVNQCRALLNTSVNTYVPR